MNYYLVGIKGTGMSALACYLKQAGNNVYGSDVNRTFFTDELLEKNNISVYPYDEKNIDGHDIYIVGLGIREDNVEFSKILDNDYPFYFYNKFIDLFIKKPMIAVSGTHGKTTTSYFLSQMGGKQISAVIGDGTGVYNEEAKFFVMEACEYKNHFFAYHPEFVIIQNLELDHPDFFKNKKQLINSYNEFIKDAKTVLINGDIKDSKKIRHQAIFTYGFKESNDFIIKIIKQDEVGYFILLKGHKLCRTLEVRVCGEFNLLNYVASYLTLYLLDLQIKKTNIKLPHRRMDKFIINNKACIVDYSHHPLEIERLYYALKSRYQTQKFILFFQFHTYTRTLRFKKQFKKVFKKFDKVYLDDVFTSSREKKNDLIQKKINNYFKIFNKYTYVDFIKETCDNDVIIIIAGAGDLAERINNLYNLENKDNNK